MCSSISNSDITVFYSRVIQVPKVACYLDLFPP